MAVMKFLCDTKRCIECNGCVTACKNENDSALEWGIQRRRVVTINDGQPGEASISVACMHCTDAPCMAVCPADCFYRTEDGIVLHDKDTCIGCGYCFYACPFGAPQFPKKTAFGSRGKMDKCTFCDHRVKDGLNPACVAVCPTKCMYFGDLDDPNSDVTKVIKERKYKTLIPEAGTIPHLYFLI